MAKYKMNLTMKSLMKAIQKCDTDEDLIECSIAADELCDEGQLRDGEYAIIMSTYIPARYKKMKKMGELKSVELPEVEIEKSAVERLRKVFSKAQDMPAVPMYVKELREQIDVLKAYQRDNNLTVEHMLLITDKIMELVNKVDSTLYLTDTSEE